MSKWYGMSAVKVKERFRHLLDGFVPRAKNSCRSFYDTIYRLDLFQGDDNSAHIFWQEVKYSAICIGVCQEQKWVLGRLFLTSSEETSKCCCQQITAQGTGTLLGAHRRKCTKATETKYLVSSNSHRKLRPFKGSVGLRCIFSTVWKFRIAQDQQLPSIQFDMLKNFFIIHDQLLKTHDRNQVSPGFLLHALSEYFHCFPIVVMSTMLILSISQNLASEPCSKYRP